MVLLSSGKCGGRGHPPGAPTALNVDSATHDGGVLRWGAPNHKTLTGYRILRGSDADALETIVEDTGDLATGYTDTTAADDATHHYAVVALSVDGDGRQSATVSATTPARTPATPVIAGAPGAPSALTASLDGAGGVTLSWTDPADNAITGYRILRGDDALSMRIIKENTGSAALSYTDTSVALNRAQVYAVQARNAAGLSQLSNTVGVTTLGAPTALDASASSGRVSLSWTAPDVAGITGYQVLRGSTAQDLQALGKNTGENRPLYTDFDVRPVTAYVYAVRALGAHGSGPLSETFSITTQPRSTVLRYTRAEPDTPLISQRQQAITSRTMIANLDRPTATKLSSGSYVPDRAPEADRVMQGPVRVVWHRTGASVTTGRHPDG